MRPTRRVRLLVLGLLLPLLAACGPAASTKNTDAGQETSASTPATPRASGDARAPRPAEAGPCSYPTTGREPAREVTPPPTTPLAHGDVRVVLETSFGALPMTLHADRAPCTVNSFLSLARQDYFDDTACHRLTTRGIFILQCGDPTGTGRGGPGYSFADELTGDETYTAGTVAMANAGPDTNGSQFFLVYEDSPLPPRYTVFGHLAPEGLQRLRRLASHGTESGASDGVPAGEAVIEDVRLPGRTPDE